MKTQGRQDTSKARLTVAQAEGAEEASVLVVAALVEEAAHLVHPALALVALHPALLHLSCGGDRASEIRSESQVKEVGGMDRACTRARRAGSPPRGSSLHGANVGTSTGWRQG